MCGAERVDEWGSVQRLGVADGDTLTYGRLQARIAVRAPVGVQRRISLARALVQALHMLAPFQGAMTIALLYTIDDIHQSAPGGAHQRVSAYLRWSLAFDASGPDGALQAARARRQLRAAYAHARGELSTVYSLEPLPSEAALPVLQVDTHAERAAELSYCASSAAGAPWPTPVHAQPILDLLLRQPRRAAVQFTIERRMGDALDAEPTLRLGVGALGAAARADVLQLLARELRGYGALATSRRPSAAHAPRLRVLRANTSAECAHISTNISVPAVAPWPQDDPSGALTLTDGQAALLLPLPFALFE